MTYVWKCKNTYYRVEVEQTVITPPNPPHPKISRHRNINMHLVSYWRWHLEHHRTRNATEQDLDVTDKQQNRHFTRKRKDTVSLPLELSNGTLHGFVRACRDYFFSLHLSASVATFTPRLLEGRTFFSSSGLLNYHFSGYYAIYVFAYHILGFQSWVPGVAQRNCNAGTQEPWNLLLGCKAGFMENRLDVQGIHGKHRNFPHSSTPSRRQLWGSKHHWAAIFSCLPISDISTLPPTKQLPLMRKKKQTIATLTKSHEDRTAIYHYFGRIWLSTFFLNIFCGGY